MWFQYRPYVPVAQRRAQAARELAKRVKKGQTVSPVVIEGRTIARTFWGKAWCDNLESYSDYENRLPRGRTYVRNGSVIDLQIQPGKVTATVSGSELYEVSINITPLPDGQWRSIKSRCAGQIGSLVELLQGKLSRGVIEIVTAHNGGLFPKPSEIKMSCSCPDWRGCASMWPPSCTASERVWITHPELFLSLRQVDHLELIEEAASSAGQQEGHQEEDAGGERFGRRFGIEFAGPEARMRRRPPEEDREAEAGQGRQIEAGDESRCARAEAGKQGAYLAKDQEDGKSEPERESARGDAPGSPWRPVGAQDSAPGQAPKVAPCRSPGIAPGAPEV